MRTICRRCESVSYPLTPEGYCYLCLSQFGMATQITMLLLAYNPALSVEHMQQCLALESRPVAQHLWEDVRARLEREVEQEGLVLLDCRIETPEGIIDDAVFIERLGAMVGMAKVKGVLRPVYRLPGMGYRAWTTDSRA